MAIEQTQQSNRVLSDPLRNEFTKENIGVSTKVYVARRQTLSKEIWNPSSKSIKLEEQTCIFPITRERNDEREGWNWWTLLVLSSNRQEIAGSE